MTLSALGPVTIGTAQSRALEESSRSVKKSGISLSGAGLFAGVAKNSQSSTADSVINVGSLVGSATGNVTIDAGKALTVTGSTVAAPGTVALTGESVTIQNALDTVTTTSNAKSSSVGVSVSLNSPVISGAQSVARMGRAVAGSSSSRTQAVAGAAGALAAKNTVDAVRNALPGMGQALKAGDPLAAAGNIASLSVTFGVSKSSSKSSSVDETAVKSQVSGGDVAITARRRRPSP